jgi:hypothetical protein
LKNKPPASCDTGGITVNAFVRKGPETLVVLSGLIDQSALGLGFGNGLHPSHPAPVTDPIIVVVPADASSASSEIS